MSLTEVSKDALTSLPSLRTADGSLMSLEKIGEKLQGKHVALYFAAGWCPMCTAFEPSLIRFRESAASLGKNIEFLYVPSDDEDTDILKRTICMDMMSVPLGEEADEIKRKYNIWAGRESVKFGSQRRSGIPALVVLDSKTGEEMAFIAAESLGVDALDSWILDDNIGVW